MRGLSLKAYRESWPTRGRFAIARGSVEAVELVIVELGASGHRGRGECRPYARYGESPDAVLEAIEGLRAALEAGLDRSELQHVLPPGAARNALDLALWDLEAKESGRAVWQLAGLGAPHPVTTAYSLSLDSPEAMGKAAAENAWRPLLKLKLAGAEDLERVSAVRRAAPHARLVVDANEGWTLEDYRRLAPAFAQSGVALIEQPLPAAEDEALREEARPVPLCADESCHVSEDLPALKGKYDLVNIKLDKTGGLTEALRLKAEAGRLGFGLMVGCMLATSLAMAPAFLLAQEAALVDLDGPLLLAKDRPEGLVYRGSEIEPPRPELWG